MRFRIKIDKERCKGCALCIEACAKSIVRMAGKLNSNGQHYAEVADSSKCSGCKQCAAICPDAAIEIDGDDGAADVHADKRQEPVIAGEAR